MSPDNINVLDNHNNLYIKLFVTKTSGHLSFSRQAFLSDYRIDLYTGKGKKNSSKIAPMWGGGANYNGGFPEIVDQVGLDLNPDLQGRTFSEEKVSVRSPNVYLTQLPLRHLILRVQSWRLARVVQSAPV